MTALTQSIKRKLSLLQLAEELGNVSKACRIMGYHRDTFYEVRRAFQVGGVAALAEEKRGPRHPHPNRVAPEVEEKILDYALSFPTHGPQRVSNELRLAGTEVGPSGVRGVWSRHGIETRYKRLMRLEHHAQGDTIVLSENQIRLLERHSVEFRCRHVEASRPGELLNQGHLLLGHAQGRRQGLRTGRRRCVLLARLRQGVHGEDAGHRGRPALRPRAAVLRGPGREDRRHILTDNGREFCGIQERHPYELLLAMEEIEHRTTKIRSPRTNGFVERMNRTLLDECSAFRGGKPGTSEPTRSSAISIASCATTTSSAATTATGSRAARRLRR